MAHLGYLFPPAVLRRCQLDIERDPEDSRDLQQRLDSDMACIVFDPADRRYDPGPAELSLPTERSEAASSSMSSAPVPQGHVAKPVVNMS